MGFDCTVHLSDGNLVDVTADVWSRGYEVSRNDRGIFACWKPLKNGYRRLDVGRIYSYSTGVLGHGLVELGAVMRCN